MKKHIKDFSKCQETMIILHETSKVLWTYGYRQKITSIPHFAGKLEEDGGATIFFTAEKHE